MPRVNAIAKWPIKVRRELNERLLAAGFGDYTGLAEEFTARGYRISKSALHRYGQRIEKLTQETEASLITKRLRVVPDNDLPMTVITVVDLMTGDARVLTTPNPIADIVGLLAPLRGFSSTRGDEKTA